MLFSQLLFSQMLSSQLLSSQMLISQMLISQMLISQRWFPAHLRGRRVLLRFSVGQRCQSVGRSGQGNS